MTKKPNGYWKSWSNLEIELKPLIKKMKGLPGKKVLNKIGFGHIVAAIDSHHGGFPKVRAKLNIPQPDSKPFGYWKNIDNVIAEAEAVMKKHGFDILPPTDKLTELGYCSLPQAIVNYHGGFSKFRRIMGETKVRRANRSLKDLKYVKKEVRRIMREYGFATVPSSSEFKEIGESGITSAISAYHGGMRKFRKLMRTKQRRVADGLWEDEEYVLRYARDLMRKRKDKTLPSTTELYEGGHSSFVAAVINYHGGIQNLRIKLGQRPIVRRSGVWQDLEYTLEQAREALEKKGWEELPSQRILTKNGYNALHLAIYRYHGGITAFREKLNQHLGNKSETEKLESLLTNYTQN